MSFRVRLIGISIGVVAGLAVAMGIAYWRHQPPPPAPPAPEEIPDPRLAFDTPFKNVRPEVKYVGDQVCAECHRDIAASYAHHPMGRSMAATADSPVSELTTKEANNPFEMYGHVFRVVERDGRMYHREERHDAKGNVVVATECEAKYAMGSGTRGKSYLVEFNGRLFQSPMSWFNQKQGWDISPGFSEWRHFTRTIVGRCVFCHANLTEPVADTINQYKTPVFRGLAIGCERCHGPGELHVKAREDNEPLSKPDYTIVNPRHLEPALRESVCQQCHLQGEQAVLPRGRSEYDFRPGLPVELFWTVFVRRPELQENFHSVGQIEQMRMSRCYTGSGGQLGCISCHDPHRRPEPAQRIAYFRDRCMACHQDKGCSVELAQRQQQAENSCIACHMIKDSSRNIPHTAVTDHRILRKPETTRSTVPPALRAGQSPLVPFHADSPHVKAESLERDLGIALAQVVNNVDRTNAAMLASIGLPRLDKATDADPYDASAWLARGQLQVAIGRLQEARESLERALTLRPNSEVGRMAAADVYSRLNQPDVAERHIDEVVRINPFVPNYHLILARFAGQRGDWPKALAECEATLKLEPINQDARMLLVTCLIRTGDEKRAKMEFDKLMAMRPANEADLRRAFKLLTE